MIQLGLIEDDAGIRQMLREFFNSQASFNCVLDAASVEDFMDGWKENVKLDMVLTDIGLPGENGIKGVKLIRKRSATTEVVMLTVYDDADRIFQALCAGATGYLLKQTPLSKIKEALQSVHEGGSPMSPGIARKVVAYFNPKPQAGLTENLTVRELQILQAVEEGLSNKEVAIRLDIALETVKYHIKNIYRKLEVNSRHALISGKFSKD